MIHDRIQIPPRVSDGSYLIPPDSGIPVPILTIMYIPYRQAILGRVYWAKVPTRRSASDFLLRVRV